MTELNGDARLSPIERVVYLLRNIRRNVCFRTASITTRPFHPDIGRICARLTTQSPGRALTETFFETMLPTLIPAGQIDVLEVGCGSGSLSGVLADLRYSGRYIGIDVQNLFRQPESTSFPFTASFIQTDAHAYVPDRAYDLILSMSALEHIPEDESLISRLRSHIRPGGLQLHIVPSGWGLICYLWHGWRQYPRAAIARRFVKAQTDVFALGGVGTLLLHAVVVTAPEVLLGVSLRKWKPCFYRRLLAVALRLDSWLP